MTGDIENGLSNRACHDDRGGVRLGDPTPYRRFEMRNTPGRKSFAQQVDRIGAGLQNNQGLWIKDHKRTVRLDAARNAERASIDVDDECLRI